MWEYFYYAAKTVYKTMSMQSLASGYSTFIDEGVRRSHQVMKNVNFMLFEILTSNTQRRVIK